MDNLKSLIISTLMISTLIVGCTEDDPEIKITSFSFDSASVEVVEGTSVDLNDYLTIEGEDASKAEVVFSSNDEEIVSVDGFTLTAVAAGQTIVEATETNTNKTATINVTVIPNISVTGVTLDKESLELEIGGTAQLTATIAPKDAAEKGLTWTIAFPSGGKTVEDAPTDIATVNDEGLVTAISPGEVVVTVTTKDGDFSASASVVVTGIKVTGVSLGQATADLKVGSTLQLSAAITPADAIEKSVTWSVAFPSASKTSETTPSDIATVNEAGLVTAISAGSVVVTATTKDGDFTADINISITNVAVTSVTIAPDPVEVNVNESVQLTATVAPENATIKTVAWSLELIEAAGRTLVAAPSVDTYLEITKDGLLKAKQRCDGCSFKVIATAVDNQVTGEVNVTIKYIPVTGITLDPSSLFSIHKGQTRQMNYTVEPSNATDPTLTWKILHSGGADLCGQSSIDYGSYATVDANGLITAINPYFDDCDYNLIVQASSSDLGSPVSVEFDVTIPVDGLTINSAAGGPITGDLNLSGCSNFQFGATTVSPINASDKTVTWSVDQEGTFTIDQTGFIKMNPGLANGTTTTKVTVTANDGSGTSASVNVVVNYNGC